MENVLLIVLLLLALALVGVVLLQRSEGGGLGMGGGGGAMSQRSAATALTKLTWVFGVAFMAISLTLTVISARNAEGTSVMDRIGAGSATETQDGPAPIDTDALLPPPAATDSDTPLVPRAD
ncbi:preprotein translocase subunit SecG [Thetidibacter halocola]|uniref:Protein-export membrane protein SecG n=1 Tax=Thetidibacter halocola TaxID=2827239 RepID=A0A8J7WDP4_9RHOB|nr:preprotein translocase subunit SecG [Thetidibacter halocola]MBS0123223.1 preprotein translocase subunit SecG [Thetidibacter halocola]